MLDGRRNPFQAVEAHPLFFLSKPPSALVVSLQQGGEICSQTAAIKACLPPPSFLGCLSSSLSGLARRKEALPLPQENKGMREERMLGRGRRHIFVQVAGSQEERGLKRFKRPRSDMREGEGKTTQKEDGIIMKKRTLFSNTSAVVVSSSSSPKSQPPISHSQQKKRGGRQRKKDRPTDGLLCGVTA